MNWCRNGISMVIQTDAHSTSDRADVIAFGNKVERTDGKAVIKAT